MNDYDLQAAQLAEQRKQMLAQQLQAQDAPDGRMVGNRYIKSNPLEFLAQGLRQYMGQQGIEKNNQAQNDLSQRRSSALTDALRNYGNLAQGMPATPDMPESQGNNPSAYTPPQAAQPAKAPNMQAANLSLIGSGFDELQKMGVQGQFETVKNNEQIATEQRKLAQSQALQKQMMSAISQAKTPQEALAMGAPSDMVKTYFEAPLLGKEKLHNVNGQMVGEQTGTPVGAQIPVQRTPDSIASLAQQDAHFNIGNKTKLQIAGLDENGQLPADVSSLVKAIGNYEMAPPGAMALSRPRMQSIMAQVAEQYPDFDSTQYGVRQKSANDFATGKNGNSVRSFNVALNHLDTLGQLTDALKNNDTQALNKVSNYFSQQTGAPAVTNFNAAKQIVGDEIIKAVVGGGGGVSDREKAQQVLSAANSPEQLAGVIKTYKDLMGGQLEGLQHQYEATTGRTDFQKRFLTQKGQTAANGGVNPQAQDVRAAAASDPALAARLKALGLQ